MNAGGDPITKCPMCRYNLSGLPKSHQCPECGFEYDETMRIWDTTKTHWISLLGEFFEWFPPEGFILLILFAFYSWRLASATLCACIFVTIIWKLGIRGQSFVIVSDKGLSYKNPTGLVQHLSWTDIEVPPPSLLGFSIGSKSRKNLPNSNIDIDNRKIPAKNRLLSFCGNEFIWVTPSGNKSIWNGGVYLPIRNLRPKLRKKVKQEIYERWTAALSKGTTVAKSPSTSANP